MKVFRCRFVAPKVSDWSSVEADSPELAANEFHSRDERSWSIAYVPDESNPGARVHFARIEVDGHGELVSRIFTSGIIRRGGVRSRPSLTDVAKAVGWERNPNELLEVGWEGEEP